MPDSQWYVAVNGKKRGPFPLDRLKKTAESGGLPDDATVWRDGWQDWQPWRDVPMLAPQPAAVAPTQPQAPADGGFDEFVADYSPSADDDFGPVAATPASFDPRPAVIRTPGSTNAVTAHLEFREMVTPVLIRALYILGLLGIWGFSLLTIVSGALAIFNDAASQGVLGILIGILFLVGGSLLWRLACETSIVLFRIYEVLGEIRARLPLR